MNDLLQKAMSLLGITSSANYSFDYRKPSNVIGDPSQMKVNYGVTPEFAAQQAQNTPQLDSPAAPQSSPASQAAWQSKYQQIYDDAVKKNGIDPSIVKLLVTSENGKENPKWANVNQTGPVAGTFDIGLNQINVNPGDKYKQTILQNTKNMTPQQRSDYINGLIDSGQITGEAANLRDPKYSINRAMEMYKQRAQNLGDPALAIASYNLGAGGAALDPNGSMNRARYVYNNAGEQLPNTPFTQDPLGFVRSHMDQYRKLGLIK